MACKDDLKLVSDFLRCLVGKQFQCIGMDSLLPGGSWFFSRQTGLSTPSPVVARESW